jgi:hypothetical protein
MVAKEMIDTSCDLGIQFLLCPYGGGCFLDTATVVN